MSHRSFISRRTLLRGLGVSMGLPLLDAMLPSSGILRAASAAVGSAAGAVGKVAPTRMAVIFTPNGMNMAEWLPKTEGAGFELTATLAPLAKVKNDLLVLGGLTMDPARSHGDGGGDHARSAAAFLTGIHPYKTNGKDIRLGISMDQVAAQKIGGKTRLPSLELGLDKTQTAGNCDSGYSCAYVTNISWSSPNTPVPKETNPGAVFDRLFGSPGDRAGKETLAKRLKQRRSILDFVADDTRRLDAQLGSADHQKLDEFTTSIREIEKRVDVARAQALDMGQNGPKPDVPRPDAAPGDIGEHMRLMFDMMVLAFRMDLTRISTMMVAREGSERRYQEIGLTDGHHTLSHHGNKKDKLASIQKIDEFHVRQVAYFLEKMKNTPEGNGNLLDHSMVVFGSGISDGNRHSHDELPIVMAGKANGAIKPGRYKRYDRGTPLCNLYLSMLDTMGAPVDRHGDSTGRLSGLNA